MGNKDVQPFITTITKDVIYKMSYITGKSSKEICKDLCLHTLENKKKLTEELLPFIKWEIKIENNLYSPYDEPIERYPVTGSLERVALRIDLNSYDFAKSLAYSLGWTAPKVIAYCIERSIRDFDFVNQYIVDYLETSMGKNQKDVINGIMKDVNESLNEELSLSILLIDIMEEKQSDENFEEAFHQLLAKW